MKRTDIKIQTCDICNRFALTVKTRLVQPPNIMTKHHEFLDCKENTKMACFSCRAKLRNKDFFVNVVITLYKKYGMEYLHTLQDIALACSTGKKLKTKESKGSKMLMLLFKIEEDIKKSIVNKENYKKQMLKKVYDK